MSHFGVLVFTQGMVSRDGLAKIMMPWHMFESTNFDNEYVVDVDDTEALRQEYEKTKRYLQDEKLPAIESFRDWVEEYTGRKLLIEGEASDLDDSDKYKYGHILVGENGEVLKAVKRTNPNRKWDWYQVGGRFTGLLGAYEPTKDPRNFESCSACGGTGKRNSTPGSEAGCNVCNGKGLRLKWAADWVDEGNHMPLEAVDWEALKNKQVQERLDMWARVKAQYEKEPIPNMSFLEARKAWAVLATHSKLAKESGDKRPLWQIIDADPIANSLRNISYGIPDEVVDGEAWANNAEPLMPFAAIKGSKWYEPRSNRWPGAVAHETDGDTWQGRWRDLIDSAPEGTWVTIVDCHI